MKYSFDNWGWFSSEEIPSRQTEVVPPTCGSPVEGEPYPNFTGYQWIWLPYVTPPVETTPDPVQDPPPPVLEPRKTILTPLELINRFTDQEAKMIIRISKNNEDVELWWIKYNKATYINLEDPQTIAGIQALEQVGIIGTGRANEILNA